MRTSFQKGSRANLVKFIIPEIMNRVSAYNPSVVLNLPKGAGIAKCTSIVKIPQRD